MEERTEGRKEAEGGGGRGEEGDDSQLMERRSAPREEFQFLSFHP